MSLAVVRNVEAETGGEQRPGHLREGEQQERAATVSIDGPDGRPREDKVDEAETERCDQSLFLGRTRLSKDSRRVETKGI